MKDTVNKIIGQLVYDKVALKKAYNYYHGVRDADQFRHIEENYGIGTPTSISFTPLIKKHIDVLVGEYLELNPQLTTSCKDENTLNNILRDKQNKINSEVFSLYENELKSIVLKVFGEKSEHSIDDSYIAKRIEDIKSNIDNSFVSEYEVAAQNILTYISQSRHIDSKNKMRDLFSDLLIGGVAYYKVYEDDGNVNIRVLNPLDTFVERNVNEYYLNKSHKSVSRRWLTREQIIIEYGDLLSEENLEELPSLIRNSVSDTGAFYVRGVQAKDGCINAPTPGILGGLEVSPISTWDANYDYKSRNYNIIPVYEVEWLDYDKSKKRVRKYSSVKIGDNIYIEYDPVDDLDMSVNGIFFLDKNGVPFSIISSTMDMQDKYDLLIYYRDNLIATSGTTGQWIDIAFIPDALGDDLPDKLTRWQSYLKNGLGLYDSSQEGGELMNTTFSGYDNSVSANGIQAIQMAIDNIEMQAASVTGVFPEKLGGIQQRDAVSNVKVGLRYSTLLTKQYFTAIDSLHKEINYDYLKLAKKVYKKGITGELILGPKYSRIFTALPEHFTLTDYDVHIEDSSETFKNRETIQSLSVEMIKAGYVDPDVILNIITSKNLTEIKDYVEDSMRIKKEENNIINQLQQKNEQSEQVIKDLQKQTNEYEGVIKSLNNKIDNNAKEKIGVSMRELDLKETEIENKKEHDAKTIRYKEQQVQAEIAQTYDNNPNNDAIKNI